MRSDVPSAASASPPGERLKIAYLIDVFPRPSNAFIVEQIAAVLASGHEVDIYARSLLREGLEHPALADLLAPERLKHIVIPTGRAARLGKLVRLLAERSSRTRAMKRELMRDPFSSGKLSWLYTALSFQRSAPYDIVHVQFATVAPIAVGMRRSGVLRGSIVTSFRGADTTQALREDPDLYDDLFREGVTVKRDGRPHQGICSIRTALGRTAPILIKSLSRSLCAPVYRTTPFMSRSSGK